MPVDFDDAIMLDNKDAAVAIARTDVNTPHYDGKIALHYAT